MFIKFFLCSLNFSYSFFVGLGARLGYLLFFLNFYGFSKLLFFSNLEIYLASLTCCCLSKLLILFFFYFFDPSLLYNIFIYFVFFK